MTVETILTVIVLPIVISLLISTPLSIYAGIVAARFVLFGEIKNRANELLIHNSGPFTSHQQVEYCKKNLELFYNIVFRLDNMGYMKASEVIRKVYSSVRDEIGSISSDFYYSEVRRKSDPTKTFIQIDEHLNDISMLKPNLRILLRPTLNTF